MKRLINIAVFYFSIILLVFSGCVTVEETLCLREAEVSGPLTTAPIHLTDSVDTPSITFSPRFSYNTKNTLIGDIKQRSELYELDTTFVPSENSLTWNIATVNVGLDMDVVLSKSFAIFFGIISPNIKRIEVTNNMLITKSIPGGKKYNIFSER